MNEGARIGKTVGNNAVEGRGNPSISQHRPVTLHLGFGATDRGLGGAVFCLRTVQFLLRYQIGVFLFHR